VCLGCVVVASVTSEGCREGVPPPVLDNATSGYLASVVLSDTPACNDGRQTWTIRAEPGQQIRLKLYDFYADQPTAAPTAAAGQQLNRHTNSRGTGRWRRGVVVSGVGLINEVNRHQARFVLGWVTVCGRVNHLGM